jgi:hypothetical protein
MENLIRLENPPTLPDIFYQYTMPKTPLQEFDKILAVQCLALKCQTLKVKQEAY